MQDSSSTSSSSSSIRRFCINSTGMVGIKSIITDFYVCSMLHRCYVDFGLLALSLLGSVLAFAPTQPWSPPNMVQPQRLARFSSTLRGIRVGLSRNPRVTLRCAAVDVDLRNKERREKNLEIARRVAIGELRPIVVSFSPAFRKELKLAKRFKHTRLFLELEELQSLRALKQALIRELPHPLASLPEDSYRLAVRPTQAMGSADNVEEEEQEGDEGQDQGDEEGNLLFVETDDELVRLYAEAQQVRSSGIGKLRLQVVDTVGFSAYLEEKRGYAIAADGALPNGLRPEEAEQWIMVSFYRLHSLHDPEDLARRLRAAWEPLGVLGRVYVAREGINAQVSVPDNMLELFKQTVTAHSELDGVYLNCDEPLSKEYAPFSKLQIKPRKHVLADGLPRSLDWRENGAKLSPAEWHSKVEQLNEKEESTKPILIDIRNFYESEVGLFKGAKALDTVTFRDTWDALKETLKGVSKEKEILTYCTGGIRCEKANAYIIQELGYKNVSALRGGIVNYAQYVKEKQLR